MTYAPDPQIGDTFIKETADNHDELLFADWMAGRWDYYTTGYKDAADQLVAHLEYPLDDALFCPILFLYRHFVELKLKYMVAQLGSLSGDHMERNKFTTHQLPPLWDFIKTHLNHLTGGEVEPERLAILDHLINELHILDPDSYRLRYSHNRQLDENRLPRCLNIKHFRETMDKLVHGLDYIEAGIYMEKDWRSEQASFDF